MNFVKSIKKLSLVTLGSLVLSAVIVAQEETPATPTPTPQQRERVSKNNPTENPKTDGQPTVEPTPVEPVAANTPQKKDDPKQTQEDTEDAEIKNAIIPYYTNYLTKYELGPGDQISVEVFGQCDKGLCKLIKIPPTAVVSFPFIPGGLFVGGKTTDQVSKEIQKKLDEYIIEPQITVNLVEVVSAEFAVLGKVGTPGIKKMTRKYNVYEAITESGGLLPDADKKRITLLRRTPQGSYTPITIKLDEMIAGKIGMESLSPGDQLIIPEKKWSLTKVLTYVNMVTGFRALTPIR